MSKHISDIESQSIKPIIILDFDDTLFPSSWLSSININLHSTDISEIHFLEIQKLDDIIFNFINSICDSSIVYIISNSDSSWINFSSQKFLPKSYPLILKCIIISSRDLHSKSHPHNPELWKKLTFTTLLDFLVQKFSSNNSILNILSLGDQINDRDCLFFASSPHQHIINAKSIKFISKPSVDLLYKQIQFVHSHLISILDYNNNLDIMIELTSL